MVHALLGFKSYGCKEVSKLKTEMEQSGVNFGRDNDGAYFCFRSESLPERVVHVASDLLGPSGDERNGIQHKWNAQCLNKNVKSMVQKYEDNRFNSVFDGSVRILYHRKDIIELCRRV